MPPLHFKRHMTGAALGLLAAASAAVLWIAVRHYFSVKDEFRREPPSPLLLHPERTNVAGLQSLTLAAANGLRVSAWYIAPRNGAAIILCHGGNADRSQMLPELRALTAAGYGVLTFDWPGQGLSEGQADWGPRDASALQAATRWLATRPEVLPGKMGGLGFSMGGFMMTIEAATDQTLRALVIEAAPSDFFEHVTETHRKWGQLSDLPAEFALNHSGMPYREYRPIDRVGLIAPRPILFIAGTQDTVVPVAMTKAMFAAAKDPKELWLLPGLGHGNYDAVLQEEYRQRIVSFFDRHLMPKQSTPE